MDCGDYVVVTNARKVAVSGNKAEQKVYYSHTMFPGGLKERAYKDLIVKKPDDVSDLAPRPDTRTQFLFGVDHSRGCFWDVAEKQAS